MITLCILLIKLYIYFFLFFFLSWKFYTLFYSIPNWIGHAYGKFEMKLYRYYLLSNGLEWLLVLSGFPIQSNKIIMSPVLGLRLSIMVDPLDLGLAQDIAHKQF